MTILLHADATDAVAKAAEYIKKGKLVAFPTETVYGLGADATNGRAVAAIYEAKNRPQFNPLIIHVSNIKEAKEIAVFDRQTEALAGVFWPGALTLVLPKARTCMVSELAGAGLDTIAIRIPSKKTALRLIKVSGCPIAAPSANKSGRVSPTRVEHVIADFRDQIPMVLDDGACQIGLESTVLDLTHGQPTILRKGGVSREEIEKITGPVAISDNDNESPSAPGMMLRHYATNAPLRLYATGTNSDEVLLAFGPEPTGSQQFSVNLSPTANLKEAAANLFEMLRQLDKLSPKAIAVMPIPEHGLGAAINDRLRRAAER